MDTALSGDPPRGSSMLAVAFGTTVAMWSVGYLARLPMVRLPSPFLLALLLLCVAGGGFALGRRAGSGFRHGALAGALSGTLNLLVLAGLLAGERPNSVVPSAALWLPGSILISAILAGTGAALGARPHSGRRTTDWTAALVQVAIAAALLLLAVGGLVTSADAGLAVVDWPNTYGYNMFLYPLSRMTGGIYYEHAHRLFGALVGLTVLVATLQIQATDRRRSVRALAWGVFAAVVVQGILGGLRVTGEFTLGREAAALRPSLALALVHGVLAQLVFAGLVLLGAVSSGAWRRAGDPRPHAAAGIDRALAGSLLAVMLAQLVLGAAQRHLQALLLVHVTVGVAFVTPLAVHVGLRSWGVHSGRPPLPRLGIALAVGVGLQVGLGLGAWLATRLPAPGGAALALATAHQWFGAVLLGLAVLVTCWNRRLVARPR